MLDPEIDALVDAGGTDSSNIKGPARVPLSVANATINTEVAAEVMKEAADNLD